MKFIEIKTPSKKTRLINLDKVLYISKIDDDKALFTLTGEIKVKSVEDYEKVKLAIETIKDNKIKSLCEEDTNIGPIIGSVIR